MAARKEGNEDMNIRSRPSFPVRTVDHFLQDGANVDQYPSRLQELEDIEALYRLVYQYSKWSFGLLIPRPTC